MATTILYNTVDLNTATIITSDVDDGGAGERGLSMFSLVNANGAVITDSIYNTKTINITGLLKSTTLAGLEALIDTFHAIFTVRDKNLDIGYGVSTRRYICTAKDVNIKRPVRGANWANFEVSMVATIPFGSDTTTTSALNATGRTAQTYSDNYTFLGSAPVQLPTFTISLTAVTGGTSATVSIGNGGNGQTIVVTRTWAAADILIVDCYNKTVKVNGVEVTFNGAFPEFPVGAGVLTYVDTFTTRTFSITATYSVMYM